MPPGPQGFSRDTNPFVDQGEKYKIAADIWNLFMEADKSSWVDYVTVGRHWHNPVARREAVHMAQLLDALMRDQILLMAAGMCTRVAALSTADSNRSWESSRFLEIMPREANAMVSPSVMSEVHKQYQAHKVAEAPSKSESASAHGHNNSTQGKAKGKWKGKDWPNQGRPPHGDGDRDQGAPPRA